MPTGTARAARTRNPDDADDRVASDGSGAVTELGSTLEAQLLASSRGDAQAFADLYDSVAPRIYGLVLRILQNVRQADEVTQEAFLEIWRTSARFDPSRGSALSWVMTLAHRRAVERVRGAEDSRRPDAAERGRRILSDETRAAEGASGDAQAVRAALAALPTSQRHAVELACFGGYTHSEVSELLQAPVGSAKTWIRDGLMRLRVTLSPVAAQLP